MTRVAVAVRPYSGPLRQKVFGVLASLGVEVQAPPELGDGTSNDDAVRVLRGLQPALLLIPYHVVRTADGERTSGLELLVEVRRDLARFREVPVIMPVSVHARLAFDAAWRARPERRVLPVMEDEIDADRTRISLERFLANGTIAGEGSTAVDGRL